MAISFGLVWQSSCWTVGEVNRCSGWISTQENVCEKTTHLQGKVALRLLKVYLLVDGLRNYVVSILTAVPCITMTERLAPFPTSAPVTHRK